MHLVSLLLLFLAPLLWFLRSADRQTSLRTLVLAGAALSLVGGGLLLTQAPLWTDGGRRLAWRSYLVEAAGAALGGSREEAVVAWPSGEFLPKLSVAQKVTGPEIEVAGGGGFIAIETATETDTPEREFFTGKELPTDGTALSWDGYQIEVREEQRGFLLRWFLGNKLNVRISDAKAREVVTFDEVRPRSGSRPPRVQPLAEGLEIKASRHEQVNQLSITEMLAVREWMHGRLMLVPASGPLRLASLGDEVTKRPAPELRQAGKGARLVLYGLGRRKEQVLLQRGGSAAEPRWSFVFQQPFKMSSPLPPSPADLVVTGRPVPGDQAFALPVGPGGRLLWGKLPMQKGSDGRWSFSSELPRENDPVPEIYRPKNKPVIEESVEDRREVKVSDKVSVEIAVVDDFPAFQSLLWPALLAFAALLLTVLGLVRDEGMAEARRSWWAVLGLTLVLWSLLILRLSLALRYALDPGRVDTFAVQTVAECWLALVWAPCALLLCGRLMRPGASRPGTVVLTWLVAGLLGASQWWLVSDQWPSFTCRFPWDKLVMIVFLLLVMRFFVVGLLRGNRRKFWQDMHRSRGFGFVKPLIGFAIVAGVISLIGRGMTLVPMLSEPLQEIIGPGLLWWFMAWVWLSSQAVDWEAVLGDEDEDASPFRGWLNALMCGIVFGGLPLLMVPILFRDFGLLVAGLSLFLPLGLLMLVSAFLTRRPLRHSVALLGILGLVGPLLGYLLISSPAIQKHAGEAQVRMESWLRGDRQEWDYLFSDALPAGDESESRGLASFKVLNSVQHRWENRAITHAAGWTGQGLGTAPARRSQIPAHTLQADSVFTFYVLGDYGLLGGSLVLGVMLLPLGFCLRSAKTRFDLGHGLAVVITSAFALEAALHALMNLGFLPFTGRNFPLLAAISFTDVLRWTFLFGLAAMSLFRRHHPSLADDEEPALCLESPGRRGHSAPLAHWVAAMGLPLVSMALCIWLTQRNVLSAPDYGERRHWKRLGEGIQALVESDRLTLDPEKLMLTLQEEQFENLGDRLVIRQEVERFNALPREEKLLEPVRHSLPPEARLIENPATYLDLMDELRTQSAAPRRRPCLFALAAQTVVEQDESGLETEGETRYEVVLHPAFETGMSFDPLPDPTGLPEVRWADGTTPLIGPAWVNGVWRSATQKDSPLPWVAPLAASLEREWLDDARHLGPTAAAARYARLTLDLKWQKALQDFTAEKGRALHASLVIGLDPAGPRVPEHHLVRRLPPRVAISLMNVQDGQVLGLGSWPRMTSEAFWTRSEDGHEWLPPSSWLERKAPRSLRLRYGQEQNFSRFVMGSTTKPLFAAAALELHPFLNNRFVTRAKSQDQSSVFGIPITGRTWHTYEADGQWYNFSKYLTRSVNHYHVALGFLCLAEGDGSQIIAAPGTSKSEDESFSQKAWGKVPFFESVIGFSADQPEVMGNLHQTRFAGVLRKHFPLTTTDGQLLSTARSFWTGDEAHDAPTSSAASGESAGALAEWSPAQTHLALDSSTSRPDTVNTPRKFVSLLLGGGSNMWSNIQFSSAFATAITGKPLVAHITAGVTGRSERTPLTASRGENTAFALRPGLAGVIQETEGTASGHLGNGKAVINQLDQVGIKAYGKTGTLAAQDNQRASSRFIIAFIEWENETQGTVKRGLVLSAYGEKAGMSTTAEWLGEFIARHQIQIFEHFGKVPRAVPVGK